MIKAYIPWVEKTEKIVLVGETERLGNWDPVKGLPMKRISPFLYTSNIILDKDEQWKLILIQNETIIWEEGENRIGMPKETISFRGGRIAIGIEIPLFSLRSPSDNAIGDFGSLLQFAKKAKLDDYKVIQILPINDTGDKTDPFEVVSAFAINPIYICLDKMGTLEDVEIAHTIADNSEYLSYSQVVEWEEVRQNKWLYFRALYTQDGERICKCRDFIKFMEREKEWILPYCTFSYLSSIGDHTPYSPTLVDNLLKDKSAKSEILFYAFLQYHADKQLQEIHSELSKIGIYLSGEIPYSVSKESADVWQNPDLFQSEFYVGAMPDATYPTGQKWNRVPYSWGNKKIDRWWKSRLRKTSRYFDICRLENSIGYFRQWMIPYGYGTAIHGQIEPCRAYSAKELKTAGYEAGGTKDLEPLITKEYLTKQFGADFKRFGEFFKRKLDGRYYFKQDFKTSDNIIKYFENRKGNEEELCKGLVRIFDESLFIKTPRGFQPRIAAQYTNAYSALDTKQKEIFNKLYDNFYYIVNSDIWRKNGAKHLKMLADSSSMLLYADCKAPMEFTDTLFLAIERNGEKANYMDVYMPSKYDMTPFKQWWTGLEDSKKQEYWTEVMKWKDRASSKPIPAIYSDIVKRMKKSGSSLIILPYQDMCKLAVDYNGNPLSERIKSSQDNTNNWEWRIPSE